MRKRPARKKPGPPSSRLLQLECALRDGHGVQELQFSHMHLPVREETTTMEP